MTNQEILEKAIKKAIDGGWTIGIQWMHHVVNDYDEGYDYSGLIFNQDFAKALWGEGEISQLMLEGGEIIGPRYLWQYHLQQMVIAEDPIKYLGEHI